MRDLYTHGPRYYVIASGVPAAFWSDNRERAVMAAQAFEYERGIAAYVVECRNTSHLATHLQREA